MMVIVPQTHKEKVAMYMKHNTKKEIAEMLAACNRALDEVLGYAAMHWSDHPNHPAYYDPKV